MMQEIGPWQEAFLQSLESGDLKQVTRSLCEFDGKEYKFCCLGVACEVALWNGIKLRTRKVWTSPAFDIMYNYSTVRMPDRIIQLMKFNDSVGIFNFYNILDHSRRELTKEEAEFNLSLANCNDRGWSFKKIAKFVRKYPEVVFYEPA